MKFPLLCILTLCCCASFADVVDRDLVADTIRIKLTGQLQGAKLERFTVIKDSEDSDYTAIVTELMNSYNDLADVEINGTDEGSISVHIQFSKGWQQTCTMEIFDSSDIDIPTAKLSQECPSYWEITSVTGSEGHFEITLNGKKH